VIYLDKFILCDSAPLREIIARKGAKTLRFGDTKIIKKRLPKKIPGAKGYLERGGNFILQECRL